MARLTLFGKPVELSTDCDPGVIRLHPKVWHEIEAAVSRLIYDHFAVVQTEELTDASL
jgi:hypothetical protein